MTHKGKFRNSLLWAFIVFIFIAGAIVFLGSSNNLNGVPFIESPGSLLGTLFTSVGVIATGILAIVIKTEKNSEIVRENTQIARDQLENSHIGDPSKISNIRDDLDTKASKEDLKRLEGIINRAFESVSDDMKSSFRSLDRRIDGSTSDIRGIRADIGSLNRKHERMEERMDTVEGTTNSIKLIVGGEVQKDSGSVKTRSKPVDNDW